jgi:hypothetical protein
MDAGQPVKVRIDAYPQTALKGHVDSIQAGKLRVFSGGVFPVSRAREAYARASQVGLRGKIRLMSATGGIRLKPSERDQKSRCHSCDARSNQISLTRKRIAGSCLRHAFQSIFCASGPKVSIAPERERDPEPIRPAFSKSQRLTIQGAPRTKVTPGDVAATARPPGDAPGSEHAFPSEDTSRITTLVMLLSSACYSNTD